MRVDAGPVALEYALVGGRPRPTAVVAGGTAVPVTAETAVGLVLDGRPWSDTDGEVADVRQAPGEDRLSWVLRSGDVSVAMVVEADRAAGVVRTWAEVGGRGRLQAVELARWRGFRCSGFEATGEPVAYNAGPPGLGQPVFGPGFFAGIEHPVAENLVTGGGAGLACSLPLAVDLGEAAFATPAAVVGPGGMDRFWDYVDTLRPVPARLVALANNWYHLGALGRMDEAAVAAEAAGFAEVQARHGLGLDFLCLDDGWEGEWDAESGLWGRMAPSRFPSGPPPALLAPTRPGSPGLGLWLSPFGGYGDRRAERVAWAAEHGLEVEPGAGVLCPAGDRYRRHLASALARWTEAGVGYWKLDGVRFVCDAPDHGHPVGPGARTAQVDRFSDLVAGIRAVRPEAVVAFTIGSHPSPWWLASVDFLWRGGLDDTAEEPRPRDGAGPGPRGSRLDRFDTYIDSCLHAYRRSAVPASALVAFSVVESAAASYRDGGLSGWERHCWMAAGRGTLHHDLYVAPDSLSEAEWAVLARALHWARAHQHVLGRSRMVLGDPGQGHLYGFVAHRRGAGPATACLRNPSDRPQTVDVDWVGLLDLAAGSRVALEPQYGDVDVDGAAVTLAPFAVAVLAARASHPGRGGPRSGTSGTEGDDRSQTD